MAAGPVVGVGFSMTSMLRFGVRVGAVVLVAAMAWACTGRYESDFPVIIVNRTANTIQALANGRAVGSVDAGQTQSFSLELPESNANIFVNGTAPTPRADVTFTARDTRTGALSSETVNRGLDAARRNNAASLVSPRMMR